MFDQCFRTMYATTKGNTKRLNKHVNLMIKQKAKEGRLRDIGVHFDSLKRCNVYSNVNQETYDLVVQCVVDLNEYEFADMIYEMYIDPENKKFPISEKVLQNLKDCAAKANLDNLYEFLFKSGPEPPIIEERFQAQRKKDKILQDSFYSSLQPSFDKIPAVSDRDI